MKLKEKMTNVKNKKLFKRIEPISLALVVLLGASAVFAGVQLCEPIIGRLNSSKSS